MIFFSITQTLPKVRYVRVVAVVPQNLRDLSLTLSSNLTLTLTPILMLVPNLTLTLTTNAALTMSMT